MPIRPIMTGKRPERAVTVYAQRRKEVYKIPRGARRY